jgi:S1-C subfamily serine protease
MNTRNNRKIVLGLAILLLVMMACLPTVTPTPKASTADTPTAANTPVVGETPAVVDTPVVNNNQSVGPSSLTSEQISRLAHATVRVWGVKDQGGQVKPIYHGSGTLITATGLILTNCHVADPIAMGFPKELKPDGLVIDLVSTEDKPPVSTYLAEVVTEDPVLDLATIQIVSNLDGSKVSPSKLNLPHVPVGDSDQVQLGANIFVFGYPGIGGDTITYVTGVVSGFDAEDPVGDRAWIKTNATIAGGNSGGMAANANGEIIGVPSQVGSGGNQTITDCRITQDTNGDGVIDDKDACQPTGGFINAIRPVSWAKALIQTAQSGQAYTSPYPTPEVNNPPVTNPNPNPSTAFNLVGWADQTDNNNCPVNVVQSYPSGTMSIAAVFSYSGMNNGDAFEWHWFLNGKDVSSKTDTWKSGPQRDCFSFSLANGSNPLPDGDYVLQMFTGGSQNKVAQAQVSIGETPANPTPNPNPGPVTPSGVSVTLMVMVVDTDSGNPIPGIYFVLLKPGVDVETWAKNPQDSQVYSSGQTGSDGILTLPQTVERGQKYGVIIGNKEYSPVVGYLAIAKDAADPLKLRFKVSK